jgi:hypothetical protein
VIFKKKRRTPMTSRNMKRFAASRGAALVLAGLLVLGSGLTAMAQSANAGSGNGLEGTWRVQVTVSDCQTGMVLRTFPGIFAFAKGGTVTNTTAGQFPALFTPGFGVWQHTTGHSYSAVLEAFVFNPAGVWMQTNRFTRSIELNGDEFTDIIKLEIFDTSQNSIGTGCGASVGNRMK